MKKIINGKKYDTETATAVGEWDNGCYGRDFQRCSETLYRKRTGEFFLYGEGDPMSKYAVSCGNNEWCGGEQITPLTYSAAQQWAETHLGGDEYESIFGEVSEDDTRTQLSVSLSVAAVERAKRAAAQAGMSVSAYIETLL
jgi:hypothetical protein